MRLSEIGVNLPLGRHRTTGSYWDEAVGHRYKPNISEGSRVLAAISRSMKSFVAKT